ncbi:LysR family transcriptional regulator [Nocardiopsis composta]
MHLNLHRLEIFLRVLEHGSFSAAAQKLYMSQPSVSTQVKKLEASMGATLVDRSGARIRPTAEGRRWRSTPAACCCSPRRRSPRSSRSRACAPGGCGWAAPPPSAPTCCPA